MNRQKLRLRMDDLQVETFETARDAAERGTVRAHEEYDTATVYEPAYVHGGCACNTYDQTCQGTCAPSCAATCPGHPGCEEMETQYLTCGATCRWVGGQAQLC